MSLCITFSFLEKSITTSSESKRAAKEPSTILGVFGELGPMLANNKLVPNDSFFSFISGEKNISSVYIDYKRGKYDARLVVVMTRFFTFQRNSLPHSAGDPELLQDICGRTSDQRPVPRDVLTGREVFKQGC